jgi:hypothetical protein
MGPANRCQPRSDYRRTQEGDGRADGDHAFYFAGRKKLAFASNWRGEPAGAHIVRSNVLSERSLRLQVRVRDVATGKDMGIATFENTDDRSLFSKMHPQISQDRTWTAYTSEDKSNIYIARLGSASPRKLGG